MNYTDTQLQAAMDVAFPVANRLSDPHLTTEPRQPSWAGESSNRLAIARAFLAELGKIKPATTDDPYARLKAYAKAGARIRCLDDMLDPSKKRWLTGLVWDWCLPTKQYEVHPDDLHLVPEYAPKHPDPQENWNQYAEKPSWSQASAELLEKAEAAGVDLDAQPKANAEPETFGAHGKTWFKHVPGDPRPCDGEAFVEVMFSDGDLGYRAGDRGKDWDWSDDLHHTEKIIGWRYAEEQPEPKLPIATLAKDQVDLTPEAQAAVEKAFTEEVFGKSYQPRPGDVVRLKSGGPEMTVTQTKDNECRTQWFTNGQIKFSNFFNFCLEPANKKYN